ncbi:Nitrilase family, member 2 [Seminavis robusta]|uniref:Nitrilase family, member 2 n=1 Tax=Seminavis robusta TaxID=568900 RepID=A0A9N8DYT5_9STRA|nr:Nitrilase family, member 2 [Seminavis robusta]|eukprot:Sro475_g150430.1 Nitrilase family, member 2 (362) ;mRNA; f:33944-35029
MPSAPIFTGRERLMLPEDYRPGDDVVIIGRGKKVFQHPGNIRFREIVDSYLEAYKGAATKGLKSSILWNILTTMRNTSKDNLGFVKKDAETGLWCAVDDANARINIAQAFRDRLSNSYRSSKQHKSIKRKVDLGLIGSDSSERITFEQDFLLDENILASLVNVDAKKFYHQVEPNKRICLRNSNSVPSSMPKIESSFGRVQRKTSMSMGHLRDILDTASKVTFSSDEQVHEPKAPFPSMSTDNKSNRTPCTESSLSTLLKQFEASIDCCSEENPFEPKPIAVVKEQPPVVVSSSTDVVMTPMMAMLKSQQQDMFEPDESTSSFNLKSLDLMDESDLLLQLDDCLDFVNATWNTQPEALFSS